MVRMNELEKAMLDRVAERNALTVSEAVRFLVREADARASKGRRAKK